MNLFNNLQNYSEYLKEHPFHKNLSVNLEEYGELERKITRDTYYSVSPVIDTPYSVEMDDLIRLHYLVTSRKVTTILEFGVGQSSIVFDHALEENKLKYADFVKDNLRRSNIFECHTVDNNEQWLEEVKLNNPSLKNVFFNHCPCRMTTFNDRICTMYDNLPNVSPDFIYLDAPDQFTPIGDVRGISTNHPDRLPMAADILAFEHFLLPGTLIAVDGRTANARFLKVNLQRNWSYSYFKEYDQHFFELKEASLGIYNRKQVEFCLGADWE